MPSGGLIERRLGILKELCQAGTTQGASALSQLIGERVRLSDAQLKTIAAGRLTELSANEERLRAFIAMEIGGKGGGNIVIAFSLPSAERLLARLLCLPGEGILLTEDGASTLKETANIIGSAYLNALSEKTGMLLLPSPPDLVVGSQSRDLPLSCALPVESLVVETQFFIGDLEIDEIRGHFYLVPDEAFLKLLFLTSTRHL